MKCILFTIFSVLCLLTTYAQVSNYTVSQSSGTYTPITGGSNYNNFTNWTNSNFNGATGNGFLDDVISSTLVSIGFNFVYNGTTYTQFGVNSNGFITLGSLPASNTDYFPLSTGTSNNVISAMGGNLIGRGSLLVSMTSGSPIITITGGDISLISIGDKVSGTGISTATNPINYPTVISKTATTITISSNASSTGTGRHLRFSRSTFGIRFQTIGSSPNRTLVVQWTGWQRYTTTGAFGELYNFQIRLNETTNTIDIVYDIQGPTSVTTTTFQIGLRGNSNTDFNNRTSTTSWSSTTPGTSNSETVTLSNTVRPISGQIYTWTPPSLPLPVEMLYFEGQGYSSYNILKWSTASEYNSDYFSIQRSRDGINWTEVGKKISSGNSTVKNDYSYTDYYLNDGIVYYKLIQYDFDGKFKEYGPISIFYYKTDKKVVKYINLLGQEVRSDEKGFIFEVYDDGTMRRIIR